jgi:hypothetical protein
MLFIPLILVLLFIALGIFFAFKLLKKLRPAAPAPKPAQG